MYNGFGDEQLDLPPTEYLVPVPSRIPTEYQEVEGAYEAPAPSRVTHDLTAASREAPTAGMERHAVCQNWFTKKRVCSRGLTGRCPGGIATEYEEAKYQHSVAEHVYEYDTPVVPGYPSLHTYEDAAANCRKDVNASRQPAKQGSLDAVEKREHLRHLTLARPKGPARRAPTPRQPTGRERDRVNVSPKEAATLSDANCAFIMQQVKARLMSVDEAVHHVKRLSSSSLPPIANATSTSAAPDAEDEASPYNNISGLGVFQLPYGYLAGALQAESCMRRSLFDSAQQMPQRVRS